MSLNQEEMESKLESQLEAKESRPPSSQSQRVTSPTASHIAFTAVAIIRARRIRARRLKGRRAHHFAKRLKDILDSGHHDAASKDSKVAHAARILKGLITQRRRRIKARFHHGREKLQSSESPPSSDRLQESKPELKIETTQPDPVTKTPVPEAPKSPLSRRRRRIQARLQAKLKVAEPRVPLNPQSPSEKLEPMPKLEQQNSATKRRDRRERTKRGRKQSDRGKQAFHTKMRDSAWKSTPKRQAML